MPRRKPESLEPTWTPNQVVAGNLVRLRQRRGLTQGEVARLFSAVAGKEWTHGKVGSSQSRTAERSFYCGVVGAAVTLYRDEEVSMLWSAKRGFLATANLTSAGNLKK